MKFNFKYLIETNECHENLIKYYNQDLDLLTLFRVNQDTNVDEIKQAFRKVSKEHHPDRRGNKVIFQFLVSARNYLVTPNNLKKYKLQRLKRSLQIIPSGSPGKLILSGKKKFEKQKNYKLQCLKRSRQIIPSESPGKLILSGKKKFEKQKKILIENKFRKRKREEPVPMDICIDTLPSERKRKRTKQYFGRPGTVYHSRVHNAAVTGDGTTLCQNCEAKGGLCWQHQYLGDNKFLYGLPGTVFRNGEFPMAVTATGKLCWNCFLVKGLCMQHHLLITIPFATIRLTTGVRSATMELRIIMATWGIFKSYLSIVIILLYL